MYNKENAETDFSCFSFVEKVSVDAATTTRIKYTDKSSVGEKVKVIKVAANTYL